MSEFCFSISNNKNSKQKTHFSRLLLSDLVIFCSFILSHPLYFSYLLFFSPYLLKLFSFLSPLFITTSLLLLTLSTVFPGILDDRVSLETSDSKVGFLLDASQKVVHALRSRIDDEGIQFSLLEELESWVLVFNGIGFNVGERGGAEDPFGVVEAEFDVKGSQVPDIDLVELEAVTDKVEENPVVVVQSKWKCGGDGLGCFLQNSGPNEEEEEEEEKHVVGPVQKRTVSDDKGGENQMESSVGVVGGESKAAVNRVDENPVKSSLEYDDDDDDDDQGYYSKPKVMNVNPEALGSSTLGSFGSMRREKEWKRTLACKLYEERKNVDEEEGMDLLWETYETDTGKAKLEKQEKKVKSKEKNKHTKKKHQVEHYEDDDEEDDDDDDDDDMDEQFCCLQALKFSTGKMNLGMGRPNLNKISKALKGIGWFHQISRHGKKG